MGKTHSAARQADLRPSSSKGSSVTVLDQIQRTLGFSSKTKTVLSLVLSSVMISFCTWRFAFLDPKQMQAQIAGQEWYWYRQGIPKIGLRAHLLTCLPAGILACFQFIPAIRRKAMTFHRINGWFTSALLFATVPAAYSIAPVAYGAEPSLQTIIYVEGVVVVGCLYYAITAVRRGDVAEHRKWMIRTWSYASFIITLRAAAILGVIFVAVSERYYSTFSCDSISFMLNDNPRYLREFPECAPQLSLNNGTQPWDAKDVYIAIRASFKNGNLGIEAAIRSVFAMSAWVAFVVHGACAEAYINLTPEETKRWEAVAASRQKKA